MKFSLICLAILGTIGLVGCEGADAGMHPSGNDVIPPPDHAFVIFGADTITAEVADTSGEHSQGLMGRTSLPLDGGMLFVFANEATRSFWMKDTLIPLDIAFLNRLYEVVDIQQMEPESLTMHTSAAPAMYALEVERGWMAEHVIAVGNRAQVVYGPN
jgi:uncharacterized membrane protein (UPF0127 family)